MAVKGQVISDKFAAYHGDCCEVLPSLPDESMGLSVFSPPFSDLYNYSSDDRDMSNCTSYEQFFEHFTFLVKELNRVMIPGRIVAVHCMDLKKTATRLRDFPGDIIRTFEKHGFWYHTRFCIWKEPLRVFIRTRALGLAHKQIVKDSSLSRVAMPDYVVVFRKKGKNPTPIAHPDGLTTYAGAREPPAELVKRFAGHDNPRTNKLSHWIWQQYASPFWDDVRIDRVLPYKEAKEPDDEKHICPLQKDVIERCVVLWSNPGDKVLTPFMGVGSEVCGAVELGRKGIGVELKKSYFRQAVRNIRMVAGETEKEESENE